MREIDIDGVLLLEKKRRFHILRIWYNAEKTMKIIGGHDYYDGAGLMVDETCLFLRQKARRLVDLDRIDDHPFGLMWRLEVRARNASGFINVIPFKVIVAGVMYAGVEIRERYFSPAYRDQVAFLFDAEEVKSAWENIVQAHGASQWIYVSGQRVPVSERLDRHMRSSITQSQFDWCVDTHSAIVSVHENERNHRHGCQVIVNHACLKDLEFYKVLDPATIHMRLSDFIGGVLASNKTLTELSDRDRIVKAGFDTKSSFRRAPSGKRSARS